MKRRPLLIPCLSALVTLAVGHPAIAQPAPTADLVILHGKVYAADGKPGFHEAVAIRGDKILRVGTNTEIEGLKGPRTRVIDAAGHTVIPGLIDNHVHMLSGAGAMEGPKLAGVHDLKGLHKALRDYLAANPDVTWIRGGGFYADFTRHDLDAVTGDKPAVLMAGDGHSVVANTKALALAGVTRSTSAPAGGEIVKDPKTGEPTGLFLETAQAVMEGVLPDLSDADVERLTAKAAAEAHKAGVTTIVNVAQPWELAVYDRMNRDGRLNVRLYNALWLTPPHPGGMRPGLNFPSVFSFSQADADAFDEIRRTYPGDDRLKTGMVKIMLDGVVESHTASMLKPYADEPGVGEANYTPQELKRVIAMMDARGWQVMTHALGDRAVRIALDAYEGLPQGRRHKIEHIESMDPADIPRFGKLGVTASFQPAHASGMNDPERRAQRWRFLGYERSAWGFPWKSIKTAGGRVVFGSDWPVVSINPGRGMGVALNRRLNPPIPDQKLTVAELIDGYTRNGAYAIFEEQTRGALEPGKLADVVILANDIFATPPAGDIVVDVTILGGQVVYSRTGAP